MGFWHTILDPKNLQKTSENNFLDHDFTSEFWMIFSPSFFIFCGIWGVSKNSGFSPQIIHFFNRVCPYFHHPFWGTLIFGNTHIFLVFNQPIWGFFWGFFGGSEPPWLWPRFFGRKENSPKMNLTKEGSLLFGQKIPTPILLVVNVCIYIYTHMFCICIIAPAKMDQNMRFSVSTGAGFLPARVGTLWCRIIPVSKYLVTPIYKPFRPFGRGPTTPGLGDLRSLCSLTTYKSW